MIVRSEDLMTVWQRLRGCCLAIVLIALLFILATCVGVGWGIGRVTAASDNGGLDVILIIDQSNSLWELGGIGSDPQMLRMEGAHLFATYLGVDSQDRNYRLGLIFFGTHPMLLVPLTSLTDAAERQVLLSTLSQQPEPMGWTDINAALSLAYQELFESERADPTHATAIVIFTDGRPQTEEQDSPTAEDAYLSDLRSWITRFTNRSTAVFTVLLGNTATDADPQIRDIYRPLWMSLAGSGTGVRFYDARSSQDLAAIYHDVVVQLHQSRSQGAILNQMVEGATQIRVEIPTGWRWANFVIHKSDPTLKVSILRPDGSLLQVGDPDLQYAGERGQTSHEVWSVDRPPGGEWMVQTQGQGMVTIWLDYQLLPATPTPLPTASPTPTQISSPVSTWTPTYTTTPSPSPTWASTPTGTPQPTPTWTPMPSATPTPLSVTKARLEVLEPKADGRYPRGKSVQVKVRPADGDVGKVYAFLTCNGQPDPIPVPLTANGSELLTGQTPILEATGAYTLSVRQVSDLGRGVIFQDEVHVRFIVKPTGLSWAWILTASVLLLSAGAGGFWWRQHNRPLVEGTLHLVQGPETEKAGRTWNLGQLGRGSVTLGRTVRSDVVLAHDLEVPPQAAVIHARYDANGCVQPILTDVSGDGAVLINNQPVGRGCQLNDGDLIRIGHYLLRYENLSLRVKTRAWQPKRKSQNVKGEWR